MRIGIPLLGGKSWHGGITYIEALVKSLRQLPKQQQPRVYLIVDRIHADDLSAHLYFADMIDGMIAVGNAPPLSTDRHIQTVHIDKYSELTNYIDFIFPVNTDVMPGFCHASWIPDFQHRYLPELFQEDWADRDSAIKVVVEVARVIVLSSETAKRDLQKFYGDSGERVRVLPFHTAIPPAWLAMDAALTATRYGLASKYVICCNQFWQHKNHDTLLRAIAGTKSRIDLVCTGATTDYRNKDWFSAIKGLIDELGLRSQVFLLGFIPRVDQIQLMRRAVAVVQPSLNEGWSTVLEDARALGKPVLASDLAVHKEQAIPGVEYFDPRDSDQLALMLERAVSTFEPGPNRGAEQVAQAQVSSKLETSGRKLMEIANESVIFFANDDLRNGVSLSAVERLLTDRLQQSNAESRARLDVIGRLDAGVKQLEKRIEISEQSNALLRSQVRNTVFSKLWGKVNHRFPDLVKTRVGILYQYDPRPFRPVYANKSEHRGAARISIVVPSLNQGSFIEKTLCSVLDQEYPNLELIVQDGGSRDSTVEILKRMSGKLSHWESVPDSGQSEAINRGFVHAKGEVMAYLNSDDLLLPGALAAVAAYFDQHPNVDVVYGHRVILNEAGHEIGRWVLPPHDKNVLNWADFVPQETLFWRRGIWDRAGARIDESFTFAMDWDLLLRFQDAGARIVRLPRFLGAFRVHDNQKTSSQVDGVGLEEMNRLRARANGRSVTSEETRRHSKAYQFKSLVYSWLFRMGLLHYKGG
jgi:glycosyltransferase involved in cell wall biosynthesis